MQSFDIRRGESNKQDDKQDEMMIAADTAALRRYRYQSRIIGEMSQVSHGIELCVVHVLMGQSMPVR